MVAVVSSLNCLFNCVFNTKICVYMFVIIKIDDDESSLNKF